MNETTAQKRPEPKTFVSALSFQDLGKRQMSEQDIVLMADTDCNKLMRSIAQSMISYGHDAGVRPDAGLDEWAAGTAPYGQTVWDSLKKQEAALHAAGVSVSTPMPPTEMTLTGDRQISALNAGLVSIVTADGQATLLPVSLTSMEDRDTATDLAKVEAREQWAKQDITTSVSHFSMQANASQSTIASLNQALAPLQPAPDRGVERKTDPSLSI